MADFVQSFFFQQFNDCITDVGYGIGYRNATASRAAIFSAAVPLPPVMIAPAWPMRFPGGA